MTHEGEPNKSTKLAEWCHERLNKFFDGIVECEVCGSRRGPDSELDIEPDIYSYGCSKCNHLYR